MSKFTAAFNFVAAGLNLAYAVNFPHYAMAFVPFAILWGVVGYVNMNSINKGLKDGADDAASK